MTTRERELSRALLDALHDEDGRQLTELQLHGKANLILEQRGLRPATLSEFNAVRDLCDLRGWMTGVQGKHGGRKWNSNDAGEAARLELAHE